MMWGSRKWEPVNESRDLRPPFYTIDPFDDLLTDNDRKVFFFSFRYENSSLTYFNVDCENMVTQISNLCYIIIFLHQCYLWMK